MTGDAIHLDFLFLQQDVVTNLQYADGTIQMGAHKVSQVELVAGRTNEHRTTLGQTCYRLARYVVVSHQSTAVGIAFESLVKQFAVELVHIHGHTQQLLILLEQAYPGVDVAGAVVAVYHSHERTIRCGHHVDHLVRLREGLLEHNHRE